MVGRYEGMGVVGFTSKSIDWATPESLFAPLDQEFGFTLDVAASHQNSKCSEYFDIDRNALERKWEGVCWMNPPFGRQLKDWVKKAYESSLEGATVVCLLPCRTNTNWWHEYVLKGEVRFIRGRPKFGESSRGLWLPLSVVIFKGRARNQNM